MTEERNDDGPGNFVRDIVLADQKAGKHDGRLMTRFPPEPNGYAHLGHAKSICLNFGLAELAEHGVCNLRFDDTNPAVEEVEYVDAIKEDVRWLGFDWEDRQYFASDYFEKLHEFAIQLINKGLAYVDSQSMDEIREMRGDFHRIGKNSPFRERSVEENLDLFARMRAGEFDDGTQVLRAKIDMEHKDLKLRDPLMYRIKKVPHHRTGETWPIYPMYDWAHGLSDAIEGVTHSVCTLEFQNHRNLYDWFIDNVDGLTAKPQQIEMARLNISFTTLSKRRLKGLVDGGHVSGWDDPRMPTIAGKRRAGYAPEAIRTFCERIGVGRKDGVVDLGHLEYALRESLNATSYRAMGVLRPLKLVIENYPEDKVEWFEVDNLPGDESGGKRKVPFSKVVYVEQTDFMKEPMKKWWRLAVGNEVRLRGAALVTCNEVIEKDGVVVELRCTYDEKSPGGSAHDGRKIKGTVHWVSAEHAVDAEVRLYDRLFNVEVPGAETGDVLDDINPDSLTVLTGCKLEPSVAELSPGDRRQFERNGYFVVDKDSAKDALVFNRTISLRDSWAKLAKKQQKK